jgi:GWxTD domain-containing protein
MLWKQRNEKYNAEIEVLLYIQDETGKITAYDKYSLVKRDLDTITDLISIRRYAIPEGKMTMTVELVDMIDNDNKAKVEQAIHQIASDKDVFLSNIIPLEVIRKQTDSTGFSKNGFYIEPLPFHYADQTKRVVGFYVEIYNLSDTKSEYVMRYMIKDATDINDKGIVKAKSIQGGSTVPIIFELPIHTLISNEYNVEVSLYTRDSKLVATQTTQLSVANPKADYERLTTFNKDLSNSWVNKIDEKELEYILMAHVPIVDQKQSGILEELIKNKTLQNSKQFLYQFWTKRAPKAPESSYISYMEVARAVDKKFQSNVGYGFQTDRGHIFLKHGKPDNVITVETEVDAPPYEIWYYNQTALVKQSNVRFLFYNPSLVHNDFQLLHSNCYGERSNGFWERELYKTNQADLGPNPMDNPQAKDLGSFNRMARTYFNQF